MKKFISLMAVVMIAATSAFGQQKLFNATELNRAQKADTVKVDKAAKASKACSEAQCTKSDNADVKCADVTARKKCRANMSACVNDSVCRVAAFDRQTKPARKCATPCDQKCDRPCDKKCDNKCASSCDKKCDNKCAASCDKKCDKKCAASCDKKCAASCDKKCDRPCENAAVKSKK